MLNVTAAKGFPRFSSPDFSREFFPLVMLGLLGGFVGRRQGGLDDV